MAGVSIAPSGPRSKGPSQRAEPKGAFRNSGNRGFNADSDRGRGPVPVSNAVEYVGAMPCQIAVGGAQLHPFGKIEGLPVARLQPFAFGAPFGENLRRHHHPVGVVAGPQSPVEHPMRIGGEGQTVVRLVVATLGKGMDMRGFNHRVPIVGMGAVTGQRAGESILGHHHHAETRVPAGGL